MISTAGSICGAADALKDHGAREIHVGTTHALLCGSAVERLQKASLDSLVCTNSIPLDDEKLRQLPQIRVLSVDQLLGEAIKRIHRNESVSKLFR